MSPETSVEQRLEQIRLTRRVRWVLYGLLSIAFAAAFYASLLLIEFSLLDLYNQWSGFAERLPHYSPNWEAIFAENLLRESGITLAMGFAGTVIGIPLALLLGVLGSGRVTPYPFNFIFRSVMGVSRAIPALVWFLIFVPLAGLTAVTSTIAIAVSTIGNLGRLFTDELEEVEDGQIEAMETTGASKPQTVVFGMLSQVKTSFIAWTLYIFEVNVRQAVTLGLLGGGGIGVFIQVQQDLRAYDNMMAGIVVVLVLIVVVEMGSQRLRSYLRDDEEADGLITLIVGIPQRMAESAMK
ncbi:phosphonate ABC transporter, permease protein PhnE [Natronobacterium gregoryi]|uniref:Phosphonate ABC transporter permease phne n=2 Tax=Natronobacterium gregoryi TaxID=44930 RepID=L0AFG0_NATGS|nr:phosphonate ABC transporter, permease protein PhnE [Natronobacterium gregoryi]AFZ72576.1 phosphonate ABC transporter, permease protein PhnE [Natronobacterium gregoryi SP2]ELY71905.1 phosphonate ABC transporter permease phne [Natronobacterium gregoryi SP2]PLK19343.1 phosphonate ABC transporter, permease protein PhnE [Natronobacterium gregoryi SP2]SFJ52358.1 phosphonate transport system permease protein [Natronobacterium gregoryi]